MPRPLESDRQAPLPLPRSTTMKKKDSDKPIPKSRGAQPQQQVPKMGYSPPAIADKQAAASTTTRHQEMGALGLGSVAEEEPRYKQSFSRNPPSAAAQKLSHPPPPSIAPPPPPKNAGGGRGIGGIAFRARNNTALSSPSATDNSDYESLKPARRRLMRGFGQQSRRSRRYSNNHDSDRIPLHDMVGDQDESLKGRGVGGQDVQTKSDNSRVVCILLTIIIVALLISLMSLAMSLYTLTRFELFRRSNATHSAANISECSVKVTDCNTDVSNLVCHPVS